MPKKPFTLSVLILLATIASIAVVSQRGVPRVVATNLEKVPMEILGYKASEGRFEQAVYDELDADKHVYRHYLNDRGELIDFYVGYYGTAKGGRTSHNPYSCLPGAGWSILEAKSIGLGVEKKKTEVNYILSKKGDNYNVVLHWYQSAGTKVLSTGVAQNIERFMGLILHNRNDGAFVRVSTMAREKEIRQKLMLVKEFSENILQLIPDYWPVESDGQNN